MPLSVYDTSGTDSYSIWILSCHFYFTGCTYNDTVGVDFSLYIISLFALPSNTSGAHNSVVNLPQIYLKLKSHKLLSVYSLLVK